MTLIAEWTHDLHVLQHTFETLPELELSLEEVHPDADDGDSARVFYHWVSGVDGDAFERAMEADPHCRDLRYLSELNGRRLYRIRASKAGSNEVLYSHVAEHDIVILETTMTSDGVRSRVRLPSRESLIGFRRACEQRGLRFTLDTLYREQTDDHRDLTPAQREALLEAFDAGYFRVPRETTLEAIAGDLGISDQALSARLRRGQAALVEATLAGDRSETESGS